MQPDNQPDSADPASVTNPEASSGPAPTAESPVVSSSSEATPATATPEPAVTTDTAAPEAPASTAPKPITSEPAPVVASSANSPAPVVPSAPKRRKKTLLFVVAVVVLVLVLGAGYAFAFYIPNKPQNVWKSGLVNTGKAYDKLTDYAASAAPSKGSDIAGSFKVGGPLVADGSFNGKTAGQNGQLAGTVSVAGVKLSYELRTIASTGKAPDVYIKTDALDSLGGLLGGAGGNQFGTTQKTSSQWFVIDHTLFEQLGQKAVSQPPSRADVIALLKTVGNTNKQYLFTDDPQHAVLSIKTMVGHENKDGRSTYHYKADVNKAHLQAYLQALCANIKSDKVGKLLMQSDPSSDCSDWPKQADSFAGSGVDVWMDMHTKLIHSMRFTDAKDSSKYLEIGQDYQSGSQYPFMVTFHGKQDDTENAGTIKFTVDTSTSAFNVSSNFTSGSGDKASTFTVDLKVTPDSNPALKVEKPANAQSLLDLMKGLGVSLPTSTSPSVSSSASGSTLQVQARDTERKTDIASLQAHLEAYYAMEGKYPTLADLNSQSWRAAHMQGLDNEALKDPQGTSATLVASPTAKAYAYQPNTDGSKYTLTATLEAGGTYVKTNL